LNNNRIVTPVGLLLAFSSLVLSPVASLAQTPGVQQQYQPEFFSFQEVMIPMRDGVRQTGTNIWKSYDEWPPKKGITVKKLYFRDHGKLSFEAPRDQEAFDSYVSDPASPVPYRNRPVTPTYPVPAWTTWLVQDQRFVEYRPDVLTWKTDVLEEDVVATGDIVADLFAATSGSGCDWVVKLIDVYPRDYQTMTEEQAEKGEGPVLNGYELMVADKILRGRYRNSLDRLEPITPDQVTEFKIDLHPNNHAFLKGHRIMVQVRARGFRFTIATRRSSWTTSTWRAKGIM